MSNFRFNSYKDAVANNANKQGDCGAIIMTLVDADKNPLNPSDTEITLVEASGTETFFNWQINMITDDVTKYTNAPVDYYIKVSLEDYELSHPATTIYEKFSVEFKNCMITDLDFTNILDKTYNIYTTGVELDVPAFTQKVQQGFTRDGADTCDYEVTYAVTLADGSDLPDFIKWNFIDRKLTWSSDRKADEGTWNIAVKATVSADKQSGGLEVIQPIKLTVADGCSSDFIAFKDYIPDYNYYLGVVTDEDSNWSYASGRAKKTWTIEVTHTELGCPVSFRLERDVNGVKRPFTPAEDAVFADITLSEDNLKYYLTIEAQTDNENLEGESWKIAVAAERGLGGNNNTPVYLMFNFSVKNVCRDLPWKKQSTVNELTFNVYDQQSVALERLSLDNDFPTEWATEYCDISYTILYENGPLITTVYKNSQTISGYVYDEVTSTFHAQIKTREWIGTHSILVQANVGPGGKYGTFLSLPVQMTINEPCLSTKLLAPSNAYSTLEISRTGVQNLRQTVGAVDRFYMMYEEFPDEYGSKFADIAYELCGPRTHYITLKDAVLVQGDGKQRPNQYDVSRPYLYFKKYEIGNDIYSKDYTKPLYEILLSTNDFTDIGIYDFELHVGLADYADVEELVMPFTVTIGDCEVKSFEAPGTLATNYAIGDNKKEIGYSFAQSPCTYDIAYTAQVIEDGKDPVDLPSFMQVSATSGVLAMESKDNNDAKDYTILVIASLANIYQSAP
jgi:hypothetical protein